MVLGGDRGASSVELAVLAPVVFLLAFLPVQAGLWWHGRQVVNAAAQEGARAARVATTNPGQAEADGRTRAAEWAAMLGGRTVTGTSVSVSRSATRVDVVVTGQTIEILPGLALTVRGHAASPVERFIAP